MKAAREESANPAAIRSTHMKCFVIKFIIVVLVTTAAVVSAVFSLVAWVLREHLNDDWDWL